MPLGKQCGFKMFEHFFKKLSSSLCLLFLYDFMGKYCNQLQFIQSCIKWILHKSPQTVVIQLGSLLKLFLFYTLLQNFIFLDGIYSLKALSSIKGKVFSVLPGFLQICFFLDFPTLLASRRQSHLFRELLILFEDLAILNVESLSRI